MLPEIVLKLRHLKYRSEKNALKKDLKIFAQVAQLPRRALVVEVLWLINLLLFYTYLFIYSLNR
jgi:hypothetical protein